MSGRFPNNFNTKIETALRMAANHGVLLINDHGRLRSVATNRQNKQKLDELYRTAPQTVIGRYEIDGPTTPDQVKKMMIDDCTACGVEI